MARHQWAPSQPAVCRRRRALREKGIIKEKQANTPAKRIYLALQLMYTARDPRLDVHHSDA
ncbi:MAG: flagellar biosynthesis repressor FlbT [Pseudolabrys sp.]